MSAFLEFDHREGLHPILIGAEEGKRLAPKLNVVFVHGLGGGGYSTWTNRAKGALGFWPEALANQHPDCRCWTVNYGTKIYEWSFLSSSRMDLLDRAAWFIQELVARGISTQPIVFVAHSLGGLLVKQALQFAHSMGGSAWQAIWNQTRAVVFIASPHDGSQLADFAIKAAAVGSIAVIPRWLFRPTAILRCLRNDWSTLRYLGDWYRDHARAAGIDTYAFSEGREYRGVIVVTASSANPGIPGLTPVRLEEDHISIAKPALSTSLVYATVEQLLSKLVSQPAASAPPDLVERISGDWWGRVITSGHESALACIRIEKDRQNGHAFLSGRSFDLSGELVAEWRSRLSQLERSARFNGIDFNYVYEGTRFDQPGKVLLFGHAEMRFEEPSDPRETIKGGSGEFISIYPIDESQKETQVYGTATRRKQHMVRAVQAAEVETLRNGVDKEQRKRVVNSILSSVWQIASVGPGRAHIQQIERESRPA